MVASPREQENFTIIPPQQLTKQMVMATLRANVGTVVGLDTPLKPSWRQGLGAVPRFAIGISQVARGCLLLA